MNTKFDAILVLGISTSKNHFKNRVEKAVTLYQKGISPLIIFSGRCWGGLKNKPKKTEAELMARYAKQLGLPRKNTLIEKRSLNTVGNFYFTRKLFLDTLKLNNILIITQPKHFSKSKYLAKKILGPNIKFSFTEDNTKIPSQIPGHATIKQIRAYLDPIKNGDLNGIKKLLQKHPHYRYYRKF